jgi:transglutaminase-like putative cysteine protease
VALEINARGVPMRVWPKLLSHLVAMSVEQRRKGLPPLSHTGVRYRREPARTEIWQSAARTAELGFGDCEDLACYLAGDFVYAGHNADVVTKYVRPGLRHALTRVWTAPAKFVLIDPSAARGMRGKG